MATAWPLLGNCCCLGIVVVLDLRCRKAEFSEREYKQQQRIPEKNMEKIIEKKNTKTLQRKLFGIAKNVLCYIYTVQ